MYIHTYIHMYVIIYKNSYESNAILCWSMEVNIELFFQIAHIFWSCHE